ncbi:MAG TPA: TIR domain-containing protein [Ktedonobacteraceae bacterium]
MPLEIFCCYAREDQDDLHRLISYLSPLVRQGFIKLWADIDISAGEEWENEIAIHLNMADIILLLLTSRERTKDVSPHGR